MDNKMKSNPAVSFRVLAEGYCKSIANSKRLIDDGIILIKNERYLGAINSFRLATEEIIKAHLLNQPVAYGEEDHTKWEWLYTAIRHHETKQQVLLLEFHPNSFQGLAEFDKLIEIILSNRNDSIYVKFDRPNKRFLSPEETFSFGGDLKTTAELEYRYAMAIFKLFTLAGMPTVDSIEKVFIMQNEIEARKKKKALRRGPTR